MKGGSWLDLYVLQRISRRVVEARAGESVWDWLKLSNNSSVVVCSRGLPLVVPMRYQISGIIVGPWFTMVKICRSSQSSELEALALSNGQESVHNYDDGAKGSGFEFRIEMLHRLWHYCGWCRRRR